MLLIFWDVVTIPLILGGVDNATMDFLYWASFVTLAHLVRRIERQWVPVISPTPKPKPTKPLHVHLSFQIRNPTNHDVNCNCRPDAIRYWIFDLFVNFLTGYDTGAGIEMLLGLTSSSYVLEL